jgi:DNA mismatch repair protein MutS
MNDTIKETLVFSSYKELNQEFFTPIIKQYIDLKINHEDCLLFFRIGDFYEIFFEDAIIASNILGIVLTKKPAGKGSSIAMCGVPHHSYESYLNRLVKQGYKVGICEQMETPEEAKERGYKSLVKRDVVRIVTSGTLVEDSLLDAKDYNYLLSVHAIKDTCALCWVDISSGDFYYETTSTQDISHLIYKINPKEILISDKIEPKNINIAEDFLPIITRVSHNKFNYLSCLNILKNNYEDSEYFFKEIKEEQVIACGVLLDYILLTQKTIGKIALPKEISENSILKIDSFTRKSLEINSNIAGDRQFSLKDAIDETATSMGSRLLGLWLGTPLLDINTINKRLDVVDYFINNQEILDKLQKNLKKLLDFERAISRLAFNRGSVLDLAILRDSLLCLVDIKGVFFNQKVPPYLEEIIKGIGYYNNLTDALVKALVENISVQNKDSGFVKLGYSAKFDACKNKKQQLLKEIQDLQEQYILKTGVGGLKIVYNNLSGYAIEVSHKNSSMLSSILGFKHKQSLANTTRFTTEELMKKESEVYVVENAFSSLEKQVFNELCQLVLTFKNDFNITVKAIATLDILSSFAILAKNNNLCRPILNNSKKLKIINGRHLVVEKSLRKSKKTDFVPNNCLMENQKNLFLITGPNMSGKSTFLRQNALIIIMAQIGCYVPAELAEIGVVDAIFSRVGSSDDLAKGQSTFMVEMLELSSILRNATESSFIILDEIGRGTSTYDGLSIAWATLEHINNVIKARTLFATHYHELIDLENHLNKLECYFVKIEEHKDNIIFMHSIVKGAIQKSYGIEVGRLAGLPKPVIKRAKEVLLAMEEKKHKQEISLLNYMDFQTQNPQEINESPAFKHQEIIEDIKNINADDLTPKQALELIYELKKKIIEPTIKNKM